MKQIKKLSIIIVILMVFLLPSLSTAQITVANNSRSQTVRNTGYWKLRFYEPNPWDANPVFSYSLMYETLFGMNQVKDPPELIPVIGESMTWSPNGDAITVAINDAAEWNTGDPVTASDVKASYETAANQTRWAKDMGDRITSIVADDVAGTVVFNLNAGYEYSQRMVELMTMDVPIMNEDMLNTLKTNLEGTGDYDPMDGDLSAWSPNFWSASTPSAYKVYSGPYEPYYLDATERQEIVKLRSDWWGFGEIYQDLPNKPSSSNSPKYVEKQEFTSNVAQDTAILTDVVDLHSGYYEDVWTALQYNPKLGTYYERDGLTGGGFYRALGSVITLVPNQLRYPFNETWLRQAMAYGLNYGDYPGVAASNYWTRASQGFLSPDSPSHTNEYNATVQAKYGISYEYAKAVEIMEKHCTGNATIGWVTRANQSVPLVNVGPYQILTITGWTDVNIVTDLMASDLSTLGIQCSRVAISQGDWGNLVDNQDFNLVQQNQGLHLLNPSFRVLGGYRGEQLFNQNASSWHGPMADAYEALYEDLEGTAANATEAFLVASDMQEILATEVPEIPVCNNGFWYLYSEKYWKGWINQANEYNQLATVFTVDTMAVKARLYLTLRATGAANDAIIGFGIPPIFLLIIVFFSLIIAFGSIATSKIYNYWRDRRLYNQYIKNGEEENKKLVEFDQESSDILKVKPAKELLPYKINREDLRLLINSDEKIEDIVKLLKKSEVLSVSNDYLQLVDLIDWEENDKREFLEEMYSFTPQERMEIILDILDKSEIKNIYEKRKSGD